MRQRDYSSVVTNVKLLVNKLVIVPNTTGLIGKIAPKVHR